ncbi:MAG: hypothetical protein AAGB19_18290 [Cyanobacteria bacterium P01_F01_bin.3]
MSSSERELEHLSDYDLKLVRDRLPDTVACLYRKYPQTLLNAAVASIEPPLCEGYIPGEIYVYFSEYQDESSIAIIDGVLEKYDVSNIPENPCVIEVDIDGRPAYIQLDGRITLDRLGGVVLPEMIRNPGETMIRSLIKQLQKMNSN